MTTENKTSIADRNEIAKASQWDLSLLYASNEEWERDFSGLDALTSELESFKSKLSSAEQLAAYFEKDTAIDRIIEKLYVFAHLKADEDTANSENQARYQRIEGKYTEIAGRLAWVTPEILSHTVEELQQWAESDVLNGNKYAVIKLIRRKQHTLSEKEETLLSKAGQIFSSSSKTYNFLTNADMRFPEILDDNDQSIEMSQGRYITFLINRDRRVRKDAFDAMYDTYGRFSNTLASTLSSTVKLHNYSAEIRHFDNALASALHNDQIPSELYHNLIQSVHDALSGYFEYIELRKHMLGLDDLDMYDLYVPIVPEYEIQVPFEQAREWVLEACQPLGDEYCSVMAKAFSNRWIDMYENRGKRSGAYSSGCYDSVPYILMNYQGTLDHVFTLAHELGHSMHSWLANHQQPHRFASYPIFTAEIASTTNEALLLHYLMKQTDDPKFKAYLLNHLCDGFKGTVFRQVMFAEFELMIHELDAQGIPLTPETLDSNYYALNTTYFGDGMKANQKIEKEWSRIPHFYYNFYVYKYATSFCASQIFFKQVLDGESGRDAYLNLLKAGGSNDPLDLIRDAGVDLLQPNAYHAAFELFNRSVSDLSLALKER